MNTVELKEAAKLFGADLVGVASAETLAYLPPKNNPLMIFPQAKSVIVIGRKIPRGALRGIEQGTEMSNSFNAFGLYTLEDNLLAKTTYDLNIWIEARGFDGVPLFAYDKDDNAVGVPVEPGKPAPNVMLNAMVLGQACGLGEIGLNGLFITPEFGPRQRLAMLLTDAELEPDTPFVPRLCKGCHACVDACPLSALDAANISAKGLKGAESDVAARDNNRCLKCRNGAVQTNAGRFFTVDRIASACGRACIAALEERGLTQEKFNHPFRQSTPWKRDIVGDKF